MIQEGGYMRENSGGMILEGEFRKEDTGGR
jgi:hypothetical protein